MLDHDLRPGNLDFYLNAFHLREVVDPRRQSGLGASTVRFGSRP